jgi:DNA polymerase
LRAQSVENKVRASALVASACRPWLEAEIAAIGPELIFGLGATAAQTPLGREFRITRSDSR